MAALIPEKSESIAPTGADAMLARESSRHHVTHKLSQRSSVRNQLLDDGEEAETVAVPATAMRLFLHLLTEMSQEGPSTNRNSRRIADNFDLELRMTFRTGTNNDAPIEDIRYLRG